MSTRIPDSTLASAFTSTSHTKPSPNIDPSTNTLPSPLKVCIIGASRGIGSGIAAAYARALAPGSKIFITGRASSASTLSAVQKEVTDINSAVSVHPLHVDITSAASVEQLAESIKQHPDGGSLDVIVLNAGWAGPEVVLKMTNGAPADFQDVFNINAIGTYHVVHYLLPLLLASEKTDVRQLLVVSTFGTILTSGPIANASYCVSKMAQLRLVEYVSEQFGKEEDGGVTCVAVHPGAVPTEMAAESCPDIFKPYLVDDVGLCGAFCVWLSREKKSWLNGRLLSAKWDVDELAAKKNVIVEQDLLKLGLRIGDISSVPTS